MAPIAEQLPVTFGNGTIWRTVAGHCAHCNAVLARDAMRGQVGRPFPRVAIIEAVGWCEPCRSETRYFYRLHDDMTLSTIVQGRWVSVDYSPAAGGGELGGLAGRLAGAVTRVLRALGAGPSRGG